MRFEVIMATSVKMAVSWDVKPRSLIDTDNVSEELTASIIRVMNAITTRRYMPEDSHHNTY
jgi:hypothetical protein